MCKGQVRPIKPLQITNITVSYPNPYLTPTSEAVFVLTDKFSYNPDREDAKAILLNLSIKRYFDDCNVPCALLCTQLIKPQNRKHLGREDHDDGVKHNETLQIYSIKT
jgi:hypothetical protein